MEDFDFGKIKRVYIAGKLSNPDPCLYIQNVSKMQDFRFMMESTFGRDYISCYAPSDDFVGGIFQGDLIYEDYIKRNMAWLLGSHAVVIMPDSEDSKGVALEREKAEENGKIKIFEYSDFETHDDFIEAFEEWL